jgi:hypothetical protein
MLVSTGSTADGTFEISDLKTVGEYVLTVTEADCPDDVSETSRSVSKAVHFTCSAYGVYWMYFTVTYRHCRYGFGMSAENCHLLPMTIAKHFWMPL